MAKDLGTIYYDYEKAKEQAAELERIAKELEQVANNEFNTALTGIYNAWKSDTAPAYIKKGKQVKEQLEKRASEIKKTASTIRSIAQNVYNADMHAYRLAQQRTYK